MRVVILGSGRGSNAKAILEAEAKGKLGKAEIVGILSDQESAGILSLGSQYDKKASFIHPGKFRTKLEGEGEDLYIQALDALNPDLIVLAGFMRVIKTGLIEHFVGKVINLHPSLLPSFPGLDGIGQAYRHGVRFTGCTVHYVIPAIDAGPILDQKIVAIESTDSEAALAKKIHQAEHELLPEVVRKLSLKQIEPRIST